MFKKLAYGIKNIFNKILKRVDFDFERLNVLQSSVRCQKDLVN